MKFIYEVRRRLDATEGCWTDEHEAVWTGTCREEAEVWVEALAAAGQEAWLVQEEMP